MPLALQLLQQANPKRFDWVMENYLIQQRLKKIKINIIEVLNKTNRPLDCIRLLAVSKLQSIERITEAITAGQRAFGENYLQEALPKIKHFEDQNLEWHFIGKIQRNKTKTIANHFSWVHSVANTLIAKRLSEQRNPNLPPLNICVQVNTQNEPSKAGVTSADLAKLLAEISKMPNLKLRGLMVMPPFTEDSQLQAEYCQEGYALFNQFKKLYHLDTLSMGTSHDLAAAITHGSTMVRIGTALFGERKKQQSIDLD